MKLKWAKKGVVIEKNNGFYYEIDHFSQEILTKFFNAKQGIYGIEMVTNDNMEEMYTFTPNTDRLDALPIQKSWEHLAEDLNESTLYEINQKTYSFLPLYTQSAINLLSEIKNIPLPNATLFTQIILTKAYNWRDTAICQYEEYQKGNDYPSDSKLIRIFQNKALSLFDKMGSFSFEREAIPECEDKILSTCYHMEIRFMVMGETGKFESELNNIIKQVDFYNELYLVKVKDKQHLFQHILNRQLQSHLSRQLFSQEEISSLILDTVMKPTIETIPVQTTIRDKVKKQYANTELRSILPDSEPRNSEMDESVVMKLTDSFKRTKITSKKITCVSMERGATLQKVTLLIPEDVVYTSIEKNLKNIQAVLGNDDISVEIGDAPDTVNFYIPCSERETVYLKDVVSTDTFAKALNNVELPLLIGEDTVGNPLVSCLAELKHILIAGATGSGKSVYLNTALVTLIMHKKPSELKLILIDPKKVELNHFAQFPHVTFISDMDKSASVFETLLVEMESRYEIMAEKGYRNVKQYNEKENKQLPYIVCVVDELSDLMDTHGSLIEESIIRLGQKARAAGIHLILCTQKPSVDVITSRIKSNLPSAISFRLKAQSDYRTVFGKGIPFHLLGKGDGVAMIEGESKEFIRFQSPVISLDYDEERNVYEKLRDVYGENEQEQFELVEQELPLDKIKRIIAQTGSTKQSDIREAMGMRMNDVSELIKQLVDEGWLMKEGKSYKIIADEDELEKWRAAN